MHNLISCSYAFCIGDIGEALEHTTGYPFIYVLENATKSVGGTTGFVSVVLILLVMITISALASSSRQMFAFARDDGLPFSKWLGTVSVPFDCQKHSLLIRWFLLKVSPHFHVPANAIIATAIFVCLVSLINVGSTVAFNAVLSLASNAVCMPRATTALRGSEILTVSQMMGTYLISIGRQHSRRTFRMSS